MHTLVDHRGGELRDVNPRRRPERVVRTAVRSRRRRRGDRAVRAVDAAGLGDRDLDVGAVLLRECQEGVFGAAL